MTRSLLVREIDSQLVAGRERALIAGFLQGRLRTGVRKAGPCSKLVAPSDFTEFACARKQGHRLRPLAQPEVSRGRENRPLAIVDSSLKTAVDEHVLVSDPELVRFVRLLLDVPKADEISAGFASAGAATPFGVGIDAVNEDDQRDERKNDDANTSEDGPLE